jgi:uncharacterized protein (TIGR03083 family)
MPRLPYADYLRHISSESARFRAVLADCDPAARVPSCPEWDAADLLWHLGTVQRFWATMLDQRPQGPDGHQEPPRPGAYADLLGFFDTQAARFASALAGADPAEETWTWSQDHTAGFIYRRQAHEALVHRLDAELAAGQVTPLDPVLAADGVDEALDVMFGGKPPWGEFTPYDRYVRVDCTDTGDVVWVQLGHFSGTDPGGTTLDTEDIAVVPDPGVEPDAVVRGTAGPLDAWLWRRGDDAGIRVTGDRAVYDRFRTCVNHPIN